MVLLVQYIVTQNEVYRNGYEKSTEILYVLKDIASLHDSALDWYSI